MTKSKKILEMVIITMKNSTFGGNGHTKETMEITLGIWKYNKQKKMSFSDCPWIYLS